MRGNHLTPLAHSRVEHLDRGGFPTVSIHVEGSGRFEPWTNYLAAHNLALGTQRAQARAIGLYIDFIAARGSEYVPLQRRALMFKAFVDSLSKGTIETGTDPSGLFWLPRSKRLVRSIVTSVHSFNEWLSQEGWAVSVNPERKATISEQVLFWHSWRMASRSKLLKHLDGILVQRIAGAGISVPVLHVRGKVPTRLPSARAYPDDAFGDLLTVGFTRPHRARWTVLRDQMIALLLHEGGLRISEPFHIWMGDVVPAPDDPEAAFVRVFHPSEGKSAFRDVTTGREMRAPRCEILRSVYDRVPLTDMAGKQHVGWKDPMLGSSDERSMMVFWRSTIAARTFMGLYRAYIRERPLVKAHPYLFITSERAPMTTQAYRKVHASAVRRIGLTPAKDLGTTPHGHRHAYGRWLHRAGVSEKVIAVVLHQKSIVSQEIYTASDEQEVLATLARLRSTCGDPFISYV